jgi:hypothetical protein
MDPLEADDASLRGVHRRTSQSEELGELFAHSLAAKDAVALKAMLQPGLAFRAITPGKFWEAHDIDTIVDDTLLGTWLAPERRITKILSIETDTVGPLHRVGYRFGVERPDGGFVIEQQAYFAADGGRISWLQIMCSGFQPDS